MRYRHCQCSDRFWAASERSLARGYPRGRPTPWLQHLGFIAGFRMIVVLAAICLTSCATPIRHSFAEPTNAWHTRAGQLLYRGPKLTLIGDVLVRYSSNGDFELTFSKAPGFTLLTLRQDAKFAEVRGTLARTGWTGPVDRAPAQLRGWLTLRDKIISSSGEQLVRSSAAGETFLIRF